MPRRAPRARITMPAHQYRPKNSAAPPQVCFSLDILPSFSLIAGF